MAELIAVTVTKKSYGGRSIQRGQSVPALMEKALRTSLVSVVQRVKAQLPGRRLAARTRLKISPTLKGASAHLVIGEGIPFANIQAKWGTSPTVITPKHGKHLAIPLTSFGKSLQNKTGTSLMEWGNDLHPHWRGKGKRGNTLYWQDNKTPHFYLAKSVKVKPSVNLFEVRDDMRLAANAAIQESFNGYDFGYLRIQKGK